MMETTSTNSTKFIQKVAIVGAGGNSGKSITEALLNNGKHTITALTRKESAQRFDPRVEVVYIDYNNPESLVSALRGHDALIITLPTGPLSGLQTHLIQAAASAGVRWVLPNEWAQDSEHEGMVADIGMQGKRGARREVVSRGVSSYIGIVTGPWYEMGLGYPEGFGFDLRRRRATLYDRGETKICVSTWNTVGRAVAEILSLPVDGGGLSLQVFRDRLVYVSSFTVNQEEIFASILRVTGHRRADWRVDYEGVRERYQRARSGEGLDPKTAQRKKGYARIFFPDDSGNFEKTKGTVNGSLGLPVEDLDQATRHAIEMLNGGDDSSDGTGGAC